MLLLLTGGVLAEVAGVLLVLVQPIPGSIYAAEGLLLLCWHEIRCCAAAVRCLRSDGYCCRTRTAVCEAVLVSVLTHR